MGEEVLLKSKNDAIEHYYDEKSIGFLPETRYEIKDIYMERIKLLNENI